MSAAAMPGGDLSLVVAAALPLLRQQQGLDRLVARRQVGKIAHGRPAASRAWSDCIGECP